VLSSLSNMQFIYAELVIQLHISSAKNKMTSAPFLSWPIASIVKVLRNRNMLGVKEYLLCKGQAMEERKEIVCSRSISTVLAPNESRHT
jgi:hypothetical protein